MNTYAAIASANASGLPDEAPDTSRAASPLSAVSLLAVFAFAIAAPALSLILLILVTGLELPAVSPRTYNGVSAGSIGVCATAWITLIQLLAPGMGGYRAGRLRSKCVSVHSDEDTRYVGQTVAQRTALSQTNAVNRVNETSTRPQTKLLGLEAAARKTADQPRKVSACTNLWVFVSLLIDAFVASLSAMWAGRQRGRQMHYLSSA